MSVDYLFTMLGGPTDDGDADFAIAETSDDCVADAAEAVLIEDAATAEREIAVLLAETTEIGLDIETVARPEHSSDAEAETPPRGVISYLDAPGGAGKTYAIVDRIEKIASDGKVILCQPTKVLIDQTAEQLSEKYPSIHREVIHSGTTEQSVVSALARYLNDSFPEPHV